MMLLDITAFSGHLHPVLVHLPIGFLLLAILLELLSYSKKFQHLASAVSIVFLSGFIAAFASSISGYLLSLAGEYDYQRLTNHQYAGMLVTVVAGLLYMMSTKTFANRIQLNKKVFSVFSILLFVLISYTGHQGGSLTHGSDYLSINILTGQKLEKPASVEEALLYEQVVQPLLQKRCSQCHRQDKRKGKLSVQSVAELIKGGKGGPALVAGNLDDSELYKRITLDPSDKKFMPADGKTPLTKNETAIIKWWIEKGMAAEGKKMAELNNAEEIKPQVAVFLGLGSIEDTAERASASMAEVNPDIPPGLSQTLIDNLQNKGVNVRIMQHNPVMLDVTIPAGSEVKAEEVKQDLLAVAKNIIWLNVSGNGLTEKDLDFLPAMTNLEKLRLEKNPLTDAIASHLSGLQQLETVNLNETGITQKCIEQLSKLPALKRVYHWQTQVASTGGSSFSDFVQSE